MGSSDPEEIRRGAGEKSRGKPTDLVSDGSNVSFKMFGDDDASLDILAEVLSSSKNSRLQKSLLFDNPKSQDVAAFQYSAKLKKLIENGIKDDELIRAKNTIKSSYIYSLQKLDTIVDSINHYNYFLNEPDSFVFDITRYENVTPEKVVDSAKKYLQKPFVELQIIPKKK